METQTMTLYADGNTFKLTVRKVTEREDGKKYIYIEDVLHEVISKIRTNKVTIDWQPTFD